MMSVTYKCKVVIVQSYIPSYRASFFAQLSSHLAKQDIECSVIAGMPQGQQAERGDAVRPEWSKPIKQKTLTIRGRTIYLPSHPAPWREADAVILGLEGTSPLVYQAILERKRGKTRLGLWGHVKPYVNHGNRIDLALERKQMDSADHIFAYTPGGKAYAVEKGVNPEKITTVMNTVDTSALESSISEARLSRNARFNAEHKLCENETICFIGGLDASKRIGFLAESLDHLWKINPRIKLLVGGRGSEESKLHRAYARQQAIPLGYVNAKKKADILMASSAICMPGRIGLVAVDALISRIPIITTQWPYHAPEAEYLRENVSRITANNDPRQYALTILSHLDQQLYSPSDVKQEDHDWAYPTLGQMVQNYALGITTLMR